MIVTDYAEFQRTFERRSELMTERLKTRPDPTGYTPPPRHVGSADAPITVSSGSMRRFYGAKWLEGLSDPSSTGTSLDHSALRAQARRKYHESVQARALVDRFADTVIDLGLRLEPAPMASVLGLTTERAEEWSKDVGDRFHLWASSRGSYRTEQMNFYQSQRLAEIQQQRENDYFARLYYNRRRDLLNPLQVGFIDADQIVGDANTVTTGLQMADDGIVTDAAGREIGYKVQWIDQAGVYHSKTIPAVGARSGRRLMLHGFRPEYAGQRRGYSPIAHAIQEFELITDYTLAEVKKAINQSNLTMFVKPSKDQVASNPWEGILRPGTAGPAAAQYGATPTDAPEGSQPLNIEDYLQYTPMPEAMHRAPGSVAMANLQEGEEVKPFESTAPKAEFDKFVDHFTSHLSASRSMPVEVLLMKFGTNYSASRGALVLFWRIAQIWRYEMEIDFLNPVYEMWLAEELAAGRVRAPGWNDPRLRAAWLHNHWWGAPLPIIDPVKAMRADRGYAEMGAHHLDEVTRNLNGGNGEINRAKLAKQYDELAIAPWTKKQEG